MASPRVFISSTYYDLKYVRSSLELFVESLGYDAVLSEVGDIAYAPDRALDESCYREVQNCDLYVLIIGGRYGSEASATRQPNRNFFERYESITRLEYKAATDKDIPIYILVERAVYAEYQTFRKNRDNETIQYAHVDSVNVFHFIEHVLAQPIGNPLHPFDKYAEIEEWLRLQWSGYFRELLQRTSSQQQIATLAAQVEELSEVNTTLRRYLEEVIARVTPEQQAKQIVDSESRRLEEAKVTGVLERNPFVRFAERSGIPSVVVHEALANAQTPEQFVHLLNNDARAQPNSFFRAWKPRNAARRDINRARETLGLEPYTWPDPPIVAVAASTSDEGGDLSI